MSSRPPSRPPSSIASQRFRPSRVPLVTGALLALIGAVLLIAGVWLLSLGGSAYYLAAGLGFLVSGGLMMRREAASLWVFALLVAATLAWALWEVGLDWWPLAARGDVLFVLGLWLLTPWVSRALVTRRAVPAGVDASTVPTVTPPRGGRAALALSLVLFAGVGVASWFHDATAIVGTLAPPQAATPAPAGSAPDGTPPDEWRAYGRTGYGQR